MRCARDALRPEKSDDHAQIDIFVNGEDLMATSEAATLSFGREILKWTPFRFSDCANGNYPRQVQSRSQRRQAIYCDISI